MDHRILGFAALAAVSAAEAQPGTHRVVRPRRTVELIAMGGVQGAAPIPVAEDIGPGEPPASTMFAIHDLRRRWVEHQMQASLLPEAGRGPMALADEDPFAPQTRPALGEATGGSVPALLVPDWMSGRGAASMSARFAPGCGAAPYRPSGFLAAASEVRRQAFYGMMSSAACRYGIPVGLFDAMIIRESRYNPAITSAKSAFGLTQLMPATAAGLGVNRYDVAQNLAGGAHYLRQQLDRYGQYHLALAAYNAGPGRVHGMVPAITETRGYVDGVLGNWARLSGFAGSTTPNPIPLSLPVRNATASRTAAKLVF